MKIDERVNETVRLAQDHDEKAMRQLVSVFRNIIPFEHEKAIPAFERAIMGFDLDSKTKLPSYLRQHMRLLVKSLTPEDLEKLEEETPLYLIEGPSVLGNRGVSKLGIIVKNPKLGRWVVSFKEIVSGNQTILCWADYGISWFLFLEEQCKTTD